MASPEETSVWPDKRGGPLKTCPAPPLLNPPPEPRLPDEVLSCGPDDDFSGGPDENLSLPTGEAKGPDTGDDLEFAEVGPLVESRGCVSLSSHITMSSLPAFARGLLPCLRRANKLIQCGQFMGEKFRELCKGY
jgi:hypothetical protein